MTTIVWNDVFLWIGRIVCGIVCLTPVWWVLYLIWLNGVFSGRWPWSFIVDRVQQKRFQRRQQRQAEQGD
jgi:polyferredoxin